MVYSNFCIDVCKNNSEQISLTHSDMLYNTIVIGNKGTGKSSVILKNFAHQTILNKNIGALFITSTRNLSYEIYALAKHYKRRVLFLNPSIDKDVESAIYNNDYSNLNLEYDFNKLIFNNYIVIIDVEHLKTKDSGNKFVSFVISKLEDAISSNEEQFLKPFSIYIDDAFNYLKFLDNILYYGREYNISSTLFFQNRSQFKMIEKDYTHFLDSNALNTIICSNLNIEDFRYYENLLGEGIIDKINSRNMIYYILQKNDSRVSGSGKVELNDDISQIINKKLNSIKKNLKKKKVQIIDNNSNTEINKNDNSLNEKDRNIDSLHNNVSTRETDNRNVNKNIDTNKKYENTLNNEINIKKQETSNSSELVYSGNNLNNKIELSIDWDDDDF